MYWLQATAEAKLSFGGERVYVIKYVDLFVC